MNDQVIKLLLDMGHSAEEARAVAAALDKVEVSTRKAAAGADDLKAKGAGAQQGLMGLSYAVQDFTSVLTGGGGIQRALGSVTNNVDTLLKGLGLTAGAVATGSILFTGFVAIIPILKSFWDAMSNGEKGPKPILDALDMVEERLKRIKGELAKIAAGAPPGDKESAGMVSEYLAGGQGGAIIGGMAGALAVSGRGAAPTATELADASPEAVERSVAAERMAASQSRIPFTPQMEAAARKRANLARAAAERAARKRIAAANQATASQIVGAAPTEPGAMENLMQMGRQFPGLFPPGMAGDLESLTPAALRQQGLDEQAEQDQADRLKEAGLRRRRRAQQQAREAEHADRTRQQAERHEQADRNRQVRHAVQREDRAQRADRGATTPARLAALDAQSIRRHLDQLNTIDIASQNQARQQQLMARFRQLQLSLQRIQTQFPNAMAGLPN